MAQHGFGFGLVRVVAIAPTEHQELVFAGSQFKKEGKIVLVEMGSELVSENNLPFALEGFFKTLFQVL